MFLLSEITVKERTLSGIANSGKPFMHNGTNTIVDLSELSFYDNTPVLITHDRDKRAGFGKLSIKDGQLTIDGKLLDNQFGNEIAKDADAGFPWQMSVHITPKYIHTLQGDETAIINGQTVKAPISILKQGHISEVSFTPTGVDNQTVAHIFSQQPKEQSVSEKDEKALSDKAIEQKDKAIEQKDKEIAELTAKIAELTAKLDELGKDKHKADVEAKLSQKGFKQDGEGNWTGVPFEVLLSLDGEKAGIVIDSLTPAAPDFLFSQMADKGEPQNPLLADAERRAKKGA